MKPRSPLELARRIRVLLWITLYALMFVVYVISWGLIY